MSNSLDYVRNNLKTVKPLIETQKLKLDSLKKQLEQKNHEYDEYKKVHDRKFSLKDELLSKIESISSNGNDIDVNTLSNARHYLGEINEELVEVASSLKTKQQAADKAIKKLTDCHVDVKLMEKYESTKQDMLQQELEKLESKELEDMWLQNNSNKESEKGVNSNE